MITLQEELVHTASSIGQPEDLRTIEVVTRNMPVDTITGTVYKPMSRNVIEYPKSSRARGLAIRSFSISRAFEKFLWWETGSDMYFATIAFDLSGEKPTLLPPADVKASQFVYAMKSGDTIDFRLGQGAPVFYPRQLTGGLALYMMVFESDRNTEHLGEVMKKVHEDLDADDSVVSKIKEMLKNPAGGIAQQILGVATAAMQPIATVLTNRGDKFVAPFQGYFPAIGAWDRLSDARNGVAVSFAEL